jgi:DUF4097 and DUF4098 domain-containing protein YvlB
MNKGCFTKLSLVCLLCLLVVSASCCINVGGWALNAKCERTVHLSAPLKSGLTFAAQTHNGSITIAGAEVTDCNLTATIIAHAVTEEDAREVAEQTKVKLEPFGNRLTAKIEKPIMMRNRSVSVNLNVILPNKTSLELNTHNGGVKITDITGEVDATTHNGSVTAMQISDNIKLETHNGGITCKEISGDTQLRTHNGGIKIYYSEAAKPACDVSVVTHNGGVEFVAPPNFSAEVNVSTHNGSIKTDIPITVTGKVSKGRLTGTIGTGEGKLHLETHNGSITIKGRD